MRALTSSWPSSALPERVALPSDHSTAQRMFSNTRQAREDVGDLEAARQPAAVDHDGGRPVMSSPLSRIAPALGASSPLTRLNSVDLPAPFGPMMAWRSPRATARSTPRMISVVAEALARRRAARCAGRVAAAPCRLPLRHAAEPLLTRGRRARSQAARDRGAGRRDETAPPPTRRRRPGQAAELFGSKATPTNFIVGPSAALTLR